MDKGPAEYTGENTQTMLASLAQFAPDAIRALNTTTDDTVRSQLAASTKYAPEQQALDLSNALAAARTQGAVASGPGAGLVTTADTLQRQLDPEFYQNRATIGTAIDKYLTSYDPNSFTPNDINQIQRGIGATEGAPMADSALRTLKNASTFGSALTDRWKNFGAAINNASTVLPTLRSGMSGFGIATGQPVNAGVAPITSSALANNFGFANNALNQIGATQRQVIAGQKSVLDNVNETMSATGQLLGGAGKAAAAF